jgi:Domain of unknown function (DUF4112)
MSDGTSQSPAEVPRIVVVPAGQTVVAPAEVERLRTAANHLAWLLDNAFEIPGTRFRIGIDPIIGLIPILGDLISFLIGSYIVVIANRLRVPRVVIWRMWVNLGIDFAIGSVPLVGDALDILWKANSMNARLLDRALEDPRGTARSSAAVLAGLTILLLAVTTGAVLLIVWLVQAIIHALR